MRSSGLLIGTLLCCAYHFQQDQKFSISGTAQGTTYQVTYYAKEPKVEKQDIDQWLSEIDTSMSIYKPYSLISRFNASEKSISVDKHFKVVIQKSLEIYQKSQGLFDITVAPLVQAWGFGPKPIDHEPDSTEIAAIKKCVGSNLLLLNGKNLIKLVPCVKIDVNGIAQGYSVDYIAHKLQELNVRKYVVEIGGELRINGPKPDGSAMKIGIEGPDDQNGMPVIRHIVALNKGAITTSGNYRKYRESGNQRIAHLIDPRSGYPLHTNLISVTVYARDALTADGYDNAVMAMNLPEAMAFVDRHPELEAYFIYRDGKGEVQDTMTNGFKKMVVN